MNVPKVGNKTKEAITIFTPPALTGRLWNDGELTARDLCLAVTSMAHLPEPSQTSFVVHDKDQSLGPDSVWGSMISVPWLLLCPRRHWPICTAWIMSLALLRPVVSEWMRLCMAFANSVLSSPLLGGISVLSNVYRPWSPLCCMELSCHSLLMTETLCWLINFFTGDLFH